VADKKAKQPERRMMRSNPKSKPKGSEAMSLFDILYLLLTLASVVITYLTYKETKKK